MEQRVIVLAARWEPVLDDRHDDDGLGEGDRVFQKRAIVEMYDVLENSKRA